jgi:hypothetical protein
VFGLVLICGTKPADAKVARLHVTVPVSVKDGATWKIRARGYAGTYDTIAFHAFFGSGCPQTEAAFVGGGAESLTPNKAFHISAAFIAGNPGHHQACVYLFNAASPDGPQLSRSVGYRVRP